MKFLAIPPGRDLVAHVISANDEKDAKACARFVLGQVVVVSTGDLAVEDVEVRRNADLAGVLEVRSRPIGEPGPWTKWGKFEEPKR